MDFRKRVVQLILLTTCVRCLVAFFTELGNDEIYYWTYAQHLQWNYFDHPPMVAILIRISTLNLFLQNAFFFRLGSIACAAVNTWLIFLIGKKIRDERTGWYASVLFSTSVYSSLIAGTFILPDSPQLFFWILTLYFMVGILDNNLEESKKNRYLLLMGVSIGLCVMSKISGIFLWVGFGSFVIFFRRQLLVNPRLYLSVLVSLVIISPIYFWNLQNDFVNFAFHSNRIGIFEKRFDPNSFFQQLIGSILYNNPVNFVIYCMTLPMVFRDRKILDKKLISLFLLLSLPLISILLFASLFNETLPHWSGPSYITILLLSASYLSALYRERRDLPVRMKIAKALLLIIIVIGLAAIHWYPSQLGSKDEKTLGANDITLDLNGWKQFAVKFDSLYQSDTQKGLMKTPCYMISDYWFPAAHLDYYVAHPAGIPFIAIGGLNSIHHYAWLNTYRPFLKKGDDAYFIYPTNYYGPPDSVLRVSFRSMDSTRVPQIRMNVTVRNFVVYRLHDYCGDIARNGVIKEVEP